MPRTVEASVEIEAHVETVYGYWQTLENLSRFMTNVDALCPEDEGASHWTLHGSFGATVEFNALTARDEEKRATGWGTGEARVGPSGWVCFEEAEPDRTRVEVTINYTDPRYDKVGEDATGVPDDPQPMLDRDLENLKTILEERTAAEAAQNRPPTANARSELAAFIAGGIGSTILAGTVLLIVRCAAGKRKHSDKRQRNSLEYRLYQQPRVLRSHTDSSGR